MFSRKFLLSLVFALVVLCTTVPQVAVEAKDVDSFFNNADGVTQDQSSTLRGQALKGSRHRELKQDKATEAPTSGGTDFFNTIINLILQFLPFILELLGLSTPADATEGA